MVRLGRQVGVFTGQIYTLIVLISAVTIVILPQAVRKNDSIYSFVQRKSPKGVRLYSMAIRRFGDQLMSQSGKPRRMKNSSKNMILALILNVLVIVSILILTSLFVGNSNFLMTKLGIEYGLLYLGYTCAIILLLYASFNTVVAEKDRFFVEKDMKSNFTSRLLGRLTQAVYAALGIFIVISTLQPLMYYQPVIGYAAIASIAVIAFVLWRGLEDITLTISNSPSAKTEVQSKSDTDFLLEFMKG